MISKCREAIRRHVVRCSEIWQKVCHKLERWQNLLNLGKCWQEVVKISAKFLWFLWESRVGSGTEVRKSCRPLSMLQYEFFFAKIGFDSAVNEPSKVIFLSILIPQILKYRCILLGLLLKGMRSLSEPCYSPHPLPILLWQPNAGGLGFRKAPLVVDLKERQNPASSPEMTKK